MNAPNPTSSNLLENLGRYPLLAALRDRRSRRFGLGMKMPAGPLAYQSRFQPVPLTEDEEAALVFAACGITGHALADLCYAPGGGGSIMGGLVARAYLRRHSGARIIQLITLGSPHHGTWIAYYGVGKNARQMQPDSAWLLDLAQSDPGTPTLSVWSALDNFIAPQDSSRLAGAREKILPALGHLAMLFSPVVLEILLNELSHRGDP